MASMNIIHTILDHLPAPTGPLLILLLIILTIPIIIYNLDKTFFSTTPHPPKGKEKIPLIREPPSSKTFSLKTRYEFHKDSLSLHREAWEVYLKKGKPVILPTLGYSSELPVVVPPSWIKWMASMPDTVLSNWEAFVHMDQVYYSLGDEKYLGDGYQGLLVKKFDLVVMGGKIWDEMGFAFGRWVDDTRGVGPAGEWKEIDIGETVRMIIAQLTSRFIVGVPLCRNEEYLRLACDISDGMVVTAAVGMALPPILMPIAGRLASLPVKRKSSRFRKLVEPTYNERVHHLLLNQDRHTENDQDRDPDRDHPYDHLQLILEFAQQNRPDDFKSLDEIARRLCVSNFGGIHQSAIHLTVMVLDLLGSDPEYNTIAALREEFKRVIYSDGDGNANANKLWTKAKFASLIKTDSLAREALRLYSFAGRSTMTRVMVDNLKTPGDDGIELPKGTMLSLLSKIPQTDPETYENPLKFDPFRFSRIREAATTNRTSPQPGPPVSFVTTTLDFLPFGHGKHACPGRFIFDFEVKMFFCYLLRNYDIEWPAEYQGKRPPNVYVTEACLPPKGARIRIRKRETPAF